jgi:hypothetical protein
MTERDMMLRWSLGNESAADFLAMLSLSYHIADDFVDRDKDPESYSSKMMAKLMHLAFVDIPANVFYQRYRTELAPVMSASFFIWNASNTWADGDDNAKHFSYVYREIGEQIIITVARIVGGIDHATAVTDEIYQTFHAKKTFEGWKNGES